MESSEQEAAETRQAAPREVATRQSWSNIPLPEQRASLSFEREFTQEEYELIRHGLIPEAMEDKWFIFLEDDVLYFYRSWTGNCIYQLSLRRKLVAMISSTTPTADSGLSSEEMLFNVTLTQLEFEQGRQRMLDEVGADGAVMNPLAETAQSKIYVGKYGSISLLDD